jgi:hypothetical protein
MSANESKKRESRETKTEEMGTKIEAIRGDVNARMVTCGKPNCKCAKGELHGPYFVYRLRTYGKRHSKYIPKRDVSAVKLAVEQGRAERKQSRRELQETMRTLRMMRFNLRRMFSGYGL